MKIVIIVILLALVAAAGYYMLVQSKAKKNTQDVVSSPEGLGDTTPEPARPERIVDAEIGLGVTENDVFTKLGVVTFDSEGVGSFTLLGEGEKADELQNLWNELSAKDELSFKSSAEDEDGTHYSLGLTVKKSEPDFSGALMEALTYGTGFDREDYVPSWVERSGS